MNGRILRVRPSFFAFRAENVPFRSAGRLCLLPGEQVIPFS